MSWWDAASLFTKKEGDDTFPFFLAGLKWREPMGVAQMTHVSCSLFCGPSLSCAHAQTIGLLQEMLYATPDATAELIKTGRYETTLHRLKPELDLTWHTQVGDLSPCSVFDSEGETFTEHELTEIRWRMEFDYVRLYGNSIAMRAAQDRLLRRHKVSNSSERGICRCVADVCRAQRLARTDCSRRASSGWPRDHSSSKQSMRR